MTLQDLDIHSQDIDCELHSQSFPSLVCLHHLGVPDWNCARVHSIPKPSHNSANNHLRDGIGRSLEGGTDREDNTAKHYTLSSTQFFTKEEAEYGTEEAALQRLMSRSRIGVRASYNFVDGNPNSVSTMSANELRTLLTRFPEVTSCQYPWTWCRFLEIDG